MSKLGVVEPLWMLVMMSVSSVICGTVVEFNFCVVSDRKEGRQDVTIFSSDGRARG